MAGRRAGAGLVCTAVGLTAAGCLGGASKTVTVTHTQTITSTQTVTTTGSVASAKACRGTDLRAVFAQVPNSGGAGQIAYTLTVRNTAQGACFVQGSPKGILLDVNGATLPTHIRGSGGKRVVLPLGASAMAQARFSPSVAGDGDSQSGACQPEAHTFQLDAAGGGVTEAPIRPPTSVCQQGMLNFEAFGYAG